MKFSRTLSLSAAAAALTMTCSLPAAAFEWPWNEHKETNYSYCKGFVVAALGNEVSTLSRTQLWLAWNDINRNGVPINTAWNDSYTSGFQQFHTLKASSDDEQLEQIANGDCALGRN